MQGKNQDELILKNPIIKNFLERERVIINEYLNTPSKKMKIRLGTLLEDTIC
ncbi:hypothetical protein [Salimicrobium salexigens]|uniref:Uncharacterized protein n=1 Tax=Salimicrobium salexigens TaxID=908941 RepID=A0ABY1KRD6_9BACI|nr:hypothetical protein [Salimicrobium salexigens]SIS66724.1 hypothetical protein SAMN05421758_103276 [Salimicrobium salexigens]